MAAINLELGTFVADFARAIESVDARRPIALNQRSKEPYQPGIGPHTESATILLAMDELRANLSTRYQSFETGVSYPNIKRQKCDLCLGSNSAWEWAIEVKLLRFLGDNGQPNDNMLMHILSPYWLYNQSIARTLPLLDGFYCRPIGFFDDHVRSPQSGALPVPRFLPSFQLVALH